MATSSQRRPRRSGPALGPRRISLVLVLFAGGAASVTLLMLSHTADFGGASTPDALGSVSLVDRVTVVPAQAPPGAAGAGGFAADGDDDEAQLQQQLQNQQETQQAEQQAEEQEQLDIQEAQQAEQQGQLTEQEATGSVPGS